MTGLDNASVGSLVDFQSETDQLQGLVLNLERDVVTAAVIGDAANLQSGSIVKLAPHLNSGGGEGTRKFTFPAGPHLVGKVVDVLGR